MTQLAEKLSHGWSLYQSGDAEQAEQVYRQALADEPENADIWCVLGIICRGRGQVADAVASYGEALRLRPEFVEARNNLGNALTDLGRLDEAVECFRRVLDRMPDNAQAHNNLGVALRRLGRRDEAIACYQRALELSPGYPDAYNNLGEAYKAAGRLDEAESNYRLATRLKPDYAEAHCNLGGVLLRCNRLAEALACCREALRLKPGSAEAHAKTADVLFELDQPHAALDHYRRAIELDPSFPDAYDHRAQVWLFQGKLAEAIRDFEHALRLKPEYAESHVGLAHVLLAQGDFERGLPQYEWRFRCKPLVPFSFEQPVWDGAPLAGRTILLHAEQGLGDTLQFVRYAALAKARGGRVIVACQKSLLKVLSGCAGIDALVAVGGELPPFDVYAPLASLPYLVGTTWATLPAPRGYLTADGALAEQWRRELAAFPGFKIGVAWQGNPNYSADRRRSFPLRSLTPLAEVPDVRLLSLQKGHGAEQLGDVAGRFPVIDLTAKLDELSGPFMDTAAVMKNLDLVVCPDTALAHLAGALGVPVWLALSVSPEWRWLRERDDSPWYPTMRLFRQLQPGEWDDVFERMAGALREHPPWGGPGRMVSSRDGA